MSIRCCRSIAMHDAVAGSGQLLTCVPACRPSFYWRSNGKDNHLQGTLPVRCSKLGILFSCSFSQWLSLFPFIQPSSVVSCLQSVEHSVVSTCTIRELGPADAARAAVRCATARCCISALPVMSSAMYVTEQHTAARLMPQACKSAWPIPELKDQCMLLQA